MARKSKPKPKTPDQIQAEKLKARKRDFEAVNLPADAAELPNHQGVVITRAGEKREEDGQDAKRVDEDQARRQDAFAAMQASMRKKEFVGAYDAARRFERDVFVMMGLNDRGASLDRVDCSTAGDRTDAMIAASYRVRDVKARLSERDWWLANDLIVPNGEDATWRHTIRRICGEENWNAQGAVVRALCVNIRDAYRAQDMAPSKAA